MLRNALKGDICEKVQGLPGPCSDTLLKQRRASAFYKNNPDDILNQTFNTFTGTPLGGPLDFNIPGYEDAPGTDIRSEDIDLRKMKQELEMTGEDRPSFNENEISGIAGSLVNMVKDKPTNDISYNIPSKEEFIGEKIFDVKLFGRIKIVYIILFIIVFYILFMILKMLNIF